MITLSIFFLSFIPGKRNFRNAPQCANVEASFLMPKSQAGCRSLIKMKFGVDALNPFSPAFPQHLQARHLPKS